MENTTTVYANTMTTIAINSVADLIESVWKNDVTMTKAQANKLLKDTLKNNDLASEGIVVNAEGESVTFTRKNIKPNCKVSHKYIMPHFADDVRAIISKSLNGNGMANLCLTGASGVGKTEFVHELAKEFGCKVFQINGSEGLTNADFYGNMSVAVDEKTSQNYTYFEKGVLYRAFIEGTKLDADGNQVLDADGEPIVVGKPAFFFLDEFAAMLPEVFLGVFNRAMEIPRENGKARSIEIPMDNGRVVKSHPSMVMFFAGNTVGTGNNGRYQMGFTAQGNKMDESTRNRITAYFHFGYSKSAEESIVTAMLNDDCETEKLLNFRDNVRNLFRNEKVETLFTTRSIVATCNMAKCFRDNGKMNWLADAIRVVVFNGLPEADKPAFNETIRMIWGVDIMADESRKTDYDYI